MFDKYENGEKKIQSQFNLFFIVDTLNKHKATLNILIQNQNQNDENENNIKILDKIKQEYMNN